MSGIADFHTPTPGATRRWHLQGRSAGFTIPELMIALLVLGVLTAVALPSFIDSIRKGRRSEAFAALAAMQQAQERWRTNKATYTVDLAELGLPASSKYYEFTLSPPSASASDRAFGYIVTAVGKDGTSQANDAQCRKLSVLVDKGSVKYAGCGSCDTFTYSTQDACWKQ